jgi:DNA excision repair protein ERCC-2
MIVGPGLPGLSDEQELIRMYFDERNGNGFFYAYLVPGLIKVIQSAGRVFRTPDDKGVVLLIDDRFADERYTELLPPDWFMPGRPFSTKDYRSVLADFWKN